MHKAEIILENKLIEEYFGNKNALSTSEIKKFYSLYNNDFLFKERADKCNLEKKSSVKLGGNFNKLGNTRYLLFSIAASVAVLLLFSLHYLNTKSELGNEIVLQKNNVLNLETELNEKDDLIKNLFALNIRTKDKLSELKQINKELKKGSASNNNQLAQLVHYKNRVQQGAFVPNQNFAYNTKGKYDEKIMISPAENEMLTINRPLVFKWKYDKNISELRIYNNKTNADPLKTIKIKSDSTFTYTKRLDFGTYYWKLKYSTNRKAKSGSFQVHF